MVSFDVTLFGTGSHNNITRLQSCAGLTVTTGSYQDCYVFDCGDGAIHQILSIKSPFHPKNISKFFISHLHLDHVGGLASLLSFIGSGYYRRRPNFVYHVYGPPNISALLIPMLRYSSTYMDCPIVIHELLQPGKVVECPSAGYGISIKTVAEYPAEDGYWDCFTDDYVSVRCGLLEHGVPCFGYSIKERGPTGKKIAIFGDTCDSSHMESLIDNCDLLLHELTFGPSLTDINEDYITHPPEEWKEDLEEIMNNPVTKRKWENTCNRASYICHSNAKMTGEYATKVHAKKLCCIHIGGRYSRQDPKKEKVINAMLKMLVQEYYQGEVFIGTEGLVIHVSFVSLINVCFILLIINEHFSF